MAPVRPRAGGPLTLEAELLERFAGVDGHADVWRLFGDGPLLARVVDQLERAAADRLAPVHALLRHAQLS